MTGRVSKRALETLDTDAGAPADARPAEVDRLIRVDGAVLDEVRNVFAGTELAEDDVRLASVLEARREVEGAWGRAARAFVEVGRALLRLDAVLRSPFEAAALKAGTDRLFPFSAPVASQLRAVARAVDAGLLTGDTLPASYSAAYQLTRLAPLQFEEAKRRGLVGPSTTRAAIIAFRKETERPATRVDEAALRAEQRRLKAREEGLEAELADVRGRLREIADLLSG